MIWMAVVCNIRAAHENNYINLITHLQVFSIVMFLFYRKHDLWILDCRAEAVVQDDHEAAVSD